MSSSPLPSYASYKHIRVTSPAEHVAHVQIDRQSRLNAFSEEVWTEFGAVFHQISADPEFRAVVLSGAGNRAFTSGLDVKAAASEGPFANGATDDMDEVRKAKLLRSHIEDFQSSISAMEKCEKRTFFFSLSSRLHYNSS